VLDPRWKSILAAIIALGVLLLPRAPQPLVELHAAQHHCLVRAKVPARRVATARSQSSRAPVITRNESCAASPATFEPSPDDSRLLDPYAPFLASLPFGQPIPRRARPARARTSRAIPAQHRSWRRAQAEPGPARAPPFG
jgi:hypothetical protein